MYQRTPIWVMPKLDVRFPSAVRALFRRIPLTQRAVRAASDVFMEILMVIAMWKYRNFHWLNRFAEAVANAHRFASIRDKTVRRKLAPNYDYGCKRPTVSNRYYRAFDRPNVRLETAGIDRIDADGIVGADGTRRSVDTLVLATGFDVWESNLPAIEIVGRDGRNLGKWWRDGRFCAYQGITVPGFPNFLSAVSPYAWVGMSWFSTVECLMRHMERLFGELHRQGADTFEVTEEANEKFLDRVTGLLDDSVFALGSCVGSRSYWFSPTGETPLFRPTSVRDAVRDQRIFPLTDYRFD
ncbi:hypothetical protein [Mycolicibacterium brumae]|uniref:hypothetical protein n=1 Tax=Mycolicibacterium brumae TaxID=85968 RepID=UPI0013A55F16|nr:hypothetical protein [Mycolicibacterium brumae]